METKEKNNQYFEGKLQLRNCKADILDFVAEQIEKEKGRIWIAKEVKSKVGIDLYLSSNKFLRKLGRLLKHKFECVIKESSKLHTETKDKKKLYRGTVLCKMPDFRVGDIGIFKGDEVEIISIGEKIILKNTKTGKKKTHKFDDVNKYFRIS